jgi:hypothetical protein
MAAARGASEIAPIWPQGLPQLGWIVPATAGRSRRHQMQTVVTREPVMYRRCARSRLSVGYVARARRGYVTGSLAVCVNRGEACFDNQA